MECSGIWLKCCPGFPGCLLNKILILILKGTKIKADHGEIWKRQFGRSLCRRWVWSEGIRWAGFSLIYLFLHIVLWIIHLVVWKTQGYWPTVFGNESHGKIMREKRRRIALPSTEKQMMIFLGVEAFRCKMTVLEDCLHTCGYVRSPLQNFSNCNWEMFHGSNSDKRFWFDERRFRWACKLGENRHLKHLCMLR